MEAYDNKYIMVFASHSQATYLYNELQKKGLSVEFVSTPSRIASGCSKSIIFYSKDIKIIGPEVKKVKATVNGIYKVVQNKNGYDYIKV